MAGEAALAKSVYYTAAQDNRQFTGPKPTKSYRVAVPLVVLIERQKVIDVRLMKQIAIEMGGRGGI